MKSLNKNDEKNLNDAFEAICNLYMASEKDNHSSCSCYHLEPFHTHWDKKTVQEVLYNIKAIYWKLGNKPYGKCFTKK